MNRRRFLLTAGAGLLASASGCASVHEQLASVVGSSSHPLGESVTHRGVKVTPDAYTTSTEVTLDIADSGVNLDRSAPAGATFLLTHLHVEHVGENERTFPSRGTFGGTMGDRIKHFYRGERLDRGDREDVTKKFVVAGNRLPNYIHVLLNNGFTSAVYEGEASGWLINEIPEGFDPTKATIRVTWGASSSMDDENLETFEWVLSEEGWRSPKNATSNSGSKNRTIEI